jgi:hypothetical protein
VLADTLQGDKAPTRLNERVSKAAKLKADPAPGFEEPLDRVHHTARVGIAPVKGRRGEYRVKLALERGVEGGVVLDIAFGILDAERSATDPCLVQLET